MLSCVEGSTLELVLLRWISLLVLFAWMDAGDAVLASRGPSFLAPSNRFCFLSSSCLAVTGKESSGAQPVKATPSNWEATGSSCPKYSKSGVGSGIPPAPNG